MKYVIDGIMKGKTISNISIKKQYIEVKYLDGTTDLIDKTEENKKNIVNVMSEQANKYVSEYSKKSTMLKKQIDDNKMVAIISLIVIFILDMLILLAGTFGFLAPLPLVKIFLCIFSIRFIISLKDIITKNKKLQDLEKYNLFVKEYEEKIKQFNQVVQKEAKLKKASKEKQNQINIMNLDKYTLKQVREMLVKAERYPNLVSLENIDSTLPDNTKPKTYVKTK